MFVQSSYSVFSSLPPWLSSVVELDENSVLSLTSSGVNWNIVALLAPTDFAEYDVNVSAEVETLLPCEVL